MGDSVQKSEGKKGIWSRVLCKAMLIIINIGYTCYPWGDGDFKEKRQK